MEPESPILDYQSPRRRRIPVISIALAALLGLLILAYVFLVPHYTVCDFSPHRMHSSDLINLHAALDTFKLDTGRYPNTPEGLQALITQPVDAQGWHGPYMEEMISDEWGRPYIYRFPGTRHPSSFDLLSVGPDGIEGTADDVCEDRK